jgi:hypothetical protein
MSGSGTPSNLKVKPCKPPRKWTASEDAQLREAVARMGGRQWKRIAECVSGRSHVQCLQRWQQVLLPGLRKGPWSKEEDVKLKQAMRKNPSTWAEVASLVGGRSSKQCRERCANHLSPNSKLSREEVAIFAQAALLKSPHKRRRRNTSTTLSSDTGTTNSVIGKVSNSPEHQTSDKLRAMLQQTEQLRHEQECLQTVKAHLNILQFRRALEHEIRTWNRPARELPTPLAPSFAVGAFPTFNEAVKQEAQQQQQQQLLLQQLQRQAIRAPSNLGLFATQLSDHTMFPHSQCPSFPHGHQPQQQQRQQQQQAADLTELWEQQTSNRDKRAAAESPLEQAMKRHMVTLSSGMTSWQPAPQTSRSPCDALSAALAPATSNVLSSGFLHSISSSTARF